MSRREILFVFPPAPGGKGAFGNHLGAAYLRAALAQAGIPTGQYLNRNPGTIDAVAVDIIRQKCQVVGFTVYDANAPLCLALSQHIKRSEPAMRIVFGGPTATFGARELMQRHAAIDLCVLGEAEATATDIFTRLLAETSFDDKALGVAFRRGDEVVCTPLPPLVGGDAPCAQASLDCTPSPYLTGILTDGRAGLLTGRGCTHHCQYCCFAALGRKRLRLHSIDRVVAELDLISEHQRRTGEICPVAIHDDAFTLVPPRAKALCQTIIDRGLKLVLACITRADAVDEELLVLMRRAGFVSLAFGLESAVPSVLRATGKVRPPDWHDADLEPERQFLEQVRNSVVNAKMHGFHVGVSIILGLPTETAAHGAETLRFVRTLPVDDYTHNLLWVFPGTPLWETHDKYGIDCTISELGLPITTAYAYDAAGLKPGRRCVLEQDLQLIRLLATDALYGCHASVAGQAGIGTVVIDSGELPARTAAWLHDVLSIGGIVLQIYPGTKQKEWLHKLDRDRSTMSDRMIPVSRYIQLRPKSSNGEQESWRIACAGLDLYRNHKPDRLSFTSCNCAAPLIAWTEGQKTDAALCELAGYMQQPDELVSLADRIESQDGESPLRRMALPPTVKYSGRWLRGKAPCLSLSRIEVDPSGKVRSCRHGEPIGEVGDSGEALSARLSDLATQAERRRGCEHCPNLHCPRCPFPGVDDRTYCHIMTMHKRAQDSLNWVWLYSRLPLLVAIQRDKIPAA